MEVTRRDLIKGSFATGAMVALGMAATGCSNASEASSGSEGQPSSYDVSETIDADIAIVGAGMSGLAAAVSASSGDKKVVVLEANTMTGGNGQGTEGVFACGSSLQKEAGIDFTLEEVISKELEFFNYRIDALRWKTLVENSADNIDWLMDQGVEFSTVDNYRGQGQVDGFHWFANGAQESYIDPMTNKATEQGAEFVLSTRARQLILSEDGSVAGVYAEKEDGSYLQVNCKAVILASGGYADNDEKLIEFGANVEGIERKGFPHHEGDGLDMAVAAGGVDTRVRHCVMREPGCAGYSFESPLGAMGVHNGGPFVFVNERGERYTNENCIVDNQAYAANCVLSQKKSFAVVNQECLEKLDSTTAEGIVDAANEAIDKGAKAFKADSLEELASAIGVDAQTLTSSFDRYNELCRKGNDDDFSKDASMMIEMAEGPFWAFQHGMFLFSTVGGIKTSRDFEVVDADDNPIPGLWAVGTDGCELYLETYTVMVPASCNANNVNSGRSAGASALEYCG